VGDGRAAREDCGMSANKVSVVITSYNRADALPKAVESVLAQSLPAFEVLVSDNCSDFDVHELLRPYEGRVRPWRNEVNLGVSGSRNAGAAAAQGDFIAFLDDDDEWKPEKLERQLAKIGDAPMSVCGKERVPGGALDVLPEQWIRPEDLKGGNIFCGGSGFFCRKSLFERVQFDPALSFGEDWDFMIQTAQIAPILYQGEALFYYNLPLAQPSLTNEVKRLRPHELERRYAAAEKNREFLGPHQYRRRIAEDTLAFVGSRRDPLAFIAHSIRRAGVAATLSVLGKRLGRRIG
jgi:glycosyltransferase involved in cell wall biosynthesis